MSRLIFEDGDPGNLPAVVDAKTGQPKSADHPAVKEAARLFTHHTTLDQRRAWHAVTCLNSRRPEDMALFQEVVAIITPGLDLLNNDPAPDPR